MSILVSSNKPAETYNILHETKHNFSDSSPNNQHVCCLFIIIFQIPSKNTASIRKSNMNLKNSKKYIKWPLKRRLPWRTVVRRGQIRSPADIHRCPPSQSRTQTLADTKLSAAEIGGGQVSTVATAPASSPSRCACEKRSKVKLDGKEGS